MVKATYNIHNDGSTELAETQELPVHSPCIAAIRRPQSEYQADIVGRKVATDVLVNGTAYVTRGRRALSVEVRIRVANVDKTLLVTGNRHWYAVAGGIAMTSAEPFETMPLTYERAFGGFDRADEDVAQHRMDDANPGTGFATRAKHLRDKAVPNVEYPSQRSANGRIDHPRQPRVRLMVVVSAPAIRWHVRPALGRGSASTLGNRLRRQIPPVGAG